MATTICTGLNSLESYIGLYPSQKQVYTDVVCMADYEDSEEAFYITPLRGNDGKNGDIKFVMTTVENFVRSIYHNSGHV